MIEVVMAAHDAGGRDLLKPLIRRWQGCDIRVTFIGASSVIRDVRMACPRFNGRFVELSDLSVLREDDVAEAVADLFRSRPDIALVATSGTVSLERQLISSAKINGVPCVAYCDMWWAPDKRFGIGDSAAWPDEIWLADPLPPGASAPPVPCIVLGHPLLCEIFESKATVVPTTSTTVRFISEPASTCFPSAGVNEFELTEMVLTAMPHNLGPLSIRLHPSDSLEAWRNWLWQHRSSRVELDVAPKQHCFNDTRAALGISSTMLVEMRHRGIPTAYLQPPKCDPEYYCVPLAEQQITRLQSVAEIQEWFGALGKSGSLLATPERHIATLARTTERLRQLSSQ